MKKYFVTRINKIFLFSFLALLLIIIFYLNYSSKNKAYIIPNNTIDIYEEKTEVNIYDDEYNKYLQLIEDYKNEKLLVLTFDDGPGKYTEYLVEELEKRNVPATFFILGSNVKGNEEVLKKTAITNEIAIHSYSHKLFTKLSNKEILEDITKTREIIKEITNIDTKIIRVPYGSLNSRVSSLLLENGYISVKWDIDSKDWHFRDKDKTYNYVMKYMKGNSIILMHDIYKSSVDCAIKLVDNLKDEYTFVTLSTFLDVVQTQK